MIQRMPKLIEPGTKWYILAIDWVKKWKTYVYFDYLEDPNPLQIPKEKRVHPGKLDNSSILMSLDSKSYCLEQMTAKLWQNNQLKPSLKEEEDFMIIDEDIFKVIQDRYGVEKNHEIVRFGISVNEDEAIVEVYLRPVSFFPIPNQLFKFQKPMTVLISRIEKLEDLQKKFQRVLNLRLYSLQERSVMVSLMRIWKSSTNDFEEIQGWEKKYKNYTQAKIEANCILSSDEDKKKVIEDLDLAEEDILIIELPKINKAKEIEWTLAPSTVSSEEESKQFETSSQTNDGNTIKLDQIISLDIERVFKPNSRRGVCGL